MDIGNSRKQTVEIFAFPETVIVTACEPSLTALLMKNSAIAFVSLSLR